MFQGPMDLLLHLIEKNEIDVYDIPIAEITRQYMDYIDDYSGDMENISAFLVMAATLLEIKSKTLLPLKAGKEEESEDPRADLAERLAEYKRYLSVLDDLRRREITVSPRFYRAPEASVLSAARKRKPRMEELLDGVSVNGLLALFNDVLSERSRLDRTVSSGSIKKEVFTIEDKICYIIDLLNARNEIYFFDLFGAVRARTEIIVTFIAVLELVRDKKAFVRQSEPFGAIVISNARAA
jgi:segregation and condensation protein A